ncbi:conjugal transfer protein TraD [Metapseudomonas otitidis]|uniref:conjugal transfer protein TraD n=1 Tax=Metapseudomonas otitidis TaxID=319939 RepID=UPI002541A1E8|nr:conjugal transfer protein TraD [Pseudomonas otitidis]WIF68114.1 conjugal transfer protein TraD [Pseudomonas otitidis]
MKENWIAERLLYIRNLKSPNDQQRLLLLLSEKEERTTEDNRKLNFLLKAEWAEVKAHKARSDVARIVQAEKDSARKARDRELYQAAGLLILAGLVDTKTGTPVNDRGELLGALLGMAKVPAHDPIRTEWKRTGDALIASKEKARTAI